MARPAGRFESFYGAPRRHLLLMLAAFALTTYAVVELGVDQLWDPEVWWQSILVWFLGAVLFHDLLLFPLVALLDRLLGRATRRRPGPARPDVSVVNHVRVPVLAVGLLFLLFFPGIIEQGASSYSRATGQTQEPFLQRWLILSAVIVASSALVYGVRTRLAKRAPRTPDTGATSGG